MRISHCMLACNDPPVIAGSLQGEKGLLIAGSLHVANYEIANKIGAFSAVIAGHCMFAIAYARSCVAGLAPPYRGAAYAIGPMAQGLGAESLANKQNRKGRRIDGVSISVCQSGAPENLPMEEAITIAAEAMSNRPRACVRCLKEQIVNVPAPCPSEALAYASASRAPALLLHANAAATPEFLPVAMPTPAFPRPWPGLPMRSALAPSQRSTSARQPPPPCLHACKPPMIAPEAAIYPLFYWAKSSRTPLARLSAAIKPC